MGFNQYLALGEETTWGTAVARNKFAKTFEGSSLEHKVERAYSATNAGNVGADPEFIFEKAQWAEGNIVMPVAYDDACFLRMLKYALGLVVTTGAGPYIHTFTRSASETYVGLNQAAGTSLSVELNAELPDTALAARLNLTSFTCCPFNSPAICGLQCSLNSENFSARFTFCIM